MRKILASQNLENKIFSTNTSLSGLLTPNILENIKHLDIHNEKLIFLNEKISEALALAKNLIDDSTEKQASSLDFKAFDLKEIEALRPKQLMALLESDINNYKLLIFETKKRVAFLTAKHMEILEALGNICPNLKTELAKAAKLGTSQKKIEAEVLIINNKENSFRKLLDLSELATMAPENIMNLINLLDQEIIDISEEIKKRHDKYQKAIKAAETIKPENLCSQIVLSQEDKELLAKYRTLETEIKEIKTLKQNPAPKKEEIKEVVQIKKIEEKKLETKKEEVKEIVKEVVKEEKNTKPEQKKVVLEPQNNERTYKIEIDGKRRILNVKINNFKVPQGYKLNEDNLKSIEKNLNESTSNLDKTQAKLLEIKTSEKK